MNTIWQPDATVMGYSSKFVVNNKLETPSQISSSQRRSVFDSSGNAKSSGRVYLVMGTICCILMFITAISLFIVPVENWPDIQKLEAHDLTKEDTTSHSISTEQCWISHSDCSDLKVTCTNIVDQHPGHVAALYLIDHMSENCTGLWSINIEDSQFPGDTLDINWLNVKNNTRLPTINKVTLHNCKSLNKVEAGAFSVFPLELEELTLFANKELKHLTSAITKGLNKLTTFNWRENAMIEYADVEAMEPFKASLQVLQIISGFSDPNVMAKLIGICQSSAFTSVEIVDLRYSQGQGMHQLGASQIYALTTVQDLYLENTGIQHLEDDVFTIVTPRSKVIHLKDNLLKTMRPNVLQPLIDTGRKIEINLAGNSWYCDCHLQWLQDLILSQESTISILGNPVCYLPDSEKNIPLRNANMTECNEEPATPSSIVINCNDETTTETITSPDSSSTMTTLDVSSTTIATDEIVCQDYEEEKLYQNNWNYMRRTKREDSYVAFPTPIPEFKITEMPNDGFKEVKIKVITGLNNNHNDPNKILVWSDSRGNLTGCFKNFKDEVEVRNLLFDETYLFCMLMNHADHTFPTHCLALKTGPSWDNRSWLTNKSQKLVIPLIIIAALLSLLLGCVIIIILFWKKPTLLAFNKRVVKIKSSYNHDAIIMPSEKRKKFSNNDFESISSDPSYISVKNISNKSLREWLQRLETTSIAKSDTRVSVSSIESISTPTTLELSPSILSHL